MVDNLVKAQKDFTAVRKPWKRLNVTIVRVLEYTQRKVSGKNSAAEIFGFNRSTLRARMRKLGIRKP